MHIESNEVAHHVITTGNNTDVKEELNFLRGEVDSLQSMLRCVRHDADELAKIIAYAREVHPDFNAVFVGFAAMKRIVETGEKTDGL